MKKTILLVSTVLLFAGLTFGQTPQTQDKGKATTTTKTEVKADAKKDSKAGCSKSCTDMKKSSCCDHGKGEAKTTEKTPEKK